MSERYVLAAQINYEKDGVPETLYIVDDAKIQFDEIFNVTNSGIEPYVTQDGLNNVAFGGIFFEENWQPRLADDIRWSESARHPFQLQAGETSIGDLVLVNDDGGLDYLIHADLVGFTTELRRGRPDQLWDDFERVFIARNKSLRFDGRTRIILELENVLAQLSSPVFDENFDDTVPNPQLEGKSKPFVLGRVNQAPLLDFDPPNLVYFGADNESRVSEVQEGGFPTKNWRLDDNGRVKFKANPSLAITANFEGDGTSKEVIFDGAPNLTDFTAFTDGRTNTTVVEQSDLIQVNLTRDGLDQFDNGVTLSAIENTAALSSPPPLANNLGFPRVYEAGQRRNVWSIPQNITVSTPATLTFDDDKINDEIVYTHKMVDTYGGVKANVNNFDAGWPFVKIAYTADITLVPNQLLYLDFYKIDEGEVSSDASEVLRQKAAFMFRHSPSRFPDNIVLLSAQYNEFIPEFYNYFSFQDAVDQRIIIKAAFQGEDGETISVTDFFFTFALHEAPIGGIEFNQDFDFNELVYAEVEYEYRGGQPLIYATSKSERSSFESGMFEPALKYNALSLDGTGTIKAMIQIPAEDNIATPPEDQNRRIRIVASAPYSPFGPDFTVGEARIINVKIIRGQRITPSYKDLVPYIATTSGIGSSAVDQSFIDAHANALGDPDLGWYVRSETVDEVLFKLAGSLFGYVWYGLDGKIRSKLLSLPTTPTGTFLLVDEGRTDPDFISSYSDDAPNITDSVNALRNWQPIPLDNQAGIIQSFYPEEQAKVEADYRITKIASGTTAEKEKFRRLWPKASSKEPYASALLDSSTAQNVADRALDVWIQKPRFYEVPVQVRLGELPLTEVGKIVQVQVDYAGLQNTPMLILGREGDARSGFVTLTLWGVPNEV